MTPNLRAPDRETGTAAGKVDGPTPTTVTPVLPNVLVVVVDTARADAFEPYGAPPGSSPAVADLARRGIAAPVVHATANWTLPSHASLLSGRLPRTLGIGSGATLDQVLIANEHNLLAPVLHDEGWHTIAISANPFIAPAHGFSLGFDRFFQVTSSRRSPRQGVVGRLKDLAIGVLADLDSGLSEIETTLGRAVSEAPPDRPWFAFVNLMECHAPYLPPRPWNDLGVMGRARAVRDVRHHESHAAVVDACLGRRSVPAASIARMRHLYDRSVTMMDAWVGRVTDHLDASGMLDDTLVIVTSDHGENFGECGRVGHTLSVDERLLRVPLVAAGASLDGDAATHITSIADVPRLIATACGLRRHPWTRRACPDGIAIAQNDGYSAINPAFAELFAREWHLDAEGIERLDRPLTAAIDGRFKLVREQLEGRYAERLHDLDADPLEQVDVRLRHPDAAARLATALDAADAERSTRIPVSSAGSTTTDPTMVERLRLLGYL